MCFLGELNRAFTNLFFPPVMFMILLCSIRRKPRSGKGAVIYNAKGA